VSKENKNISDSSNQKDWMGIIEDWRQSNKSMAEYCRERADITYDQFVNQRRRLFPDELKRIDRPETPTSWTAVTMELPSSSLDIYVKDFRIVVSSGFDQELLREVVEVLNK
jgi:hypothetical protein